MKIFLAADHAGFELKEKLKAFLTEAGHTVTDCGAYAIDPGDDYPDFISKAAQKVSECEEGSPSEASGQTQCRGIVFGGSGQGEAMVANRFKNVRAAVYYGPSVAPLGGAMEGKGEFDIIKLSREHNDANVLSLGTRFLTAEQAIEAVKLWLETPFSKETRHVRRIAKF